MYLVRWRYWSKTKIYSTRMYSVTWRYWSRTKIIAQECTRWGEGIDPKYFVSLLYISVAIKASLLKFSMFSIHKNTISSMFLFFSNFKIVDLTEIAILVFFFCSNIKWVRWRCWSKTFCFIVYWVRWRSLFIQNFLFRRLLSEVKVLTQNVLFHRCISQLLLNLASWNLTCSICTKKQ